MLQQCLPLAVLKLSDIDGSIKNIDMKLQQCLPLAVLKRFDFELNTAKELSVATVPTACGMRRRVRGSRGAKRRWGPHISSPWPKGRENKGDELTVLTACGMRRRVRGSRGAKRRWGPHISSPWPKGRENKGDEVTALTAYGIETAQLWIH